MQGRYKESLVILEKAAERAKTKEERAAVALNTILCSGHELQIERAAKLIDTNRGLVSNTRFS